jgi:integrase
MKRKNKCGRQKRWVTKQLYTVYFYNRKLFGMRSQEHRQLRLEDITIENNTMIVYQMIVMSVVYLRFITTTLS